MLALFFGFVIGIFTGMIPGIHINLVASLLPLSLGLGFVDLGLFFIGLSVSHNFFENIPNLLFGVGEDGNGLNGFALHNFYLQGRAYLGIKLVSLGNLFSSIIFLSFLPVLGFVLITFFGFFNGFSWVLLFGLELFLLLKHEFKKSLLVFLLSGLLGFYSLKTNLDQVLLSLFTGLFGLGSLIDPSDNEWVSQHRVYGLPLTKLQVLKESVLSIVSGIFLSVIPAIGPTQASMITDASRDEYERLFSLGFINGLDVYVGLFSLYLFNKGRSGVLVKLSEFGRISSGLLYYFFIAGFCISAVSFIALNYLTPKLLKVLNKVSYNFLRVTVLVFLIGLNLYFNGFLGLIIMFTGGGISYYAIRQGLLKSHLMGVLILPTIIYGLTSF